MPRWLRVSLIGLVVVFVLLTGIPVLMGGTAMACETCPSTSVMVGGPACVAVLAVALLLVFATGAGWMVRSRRGETPMLLLSLGLDRPPQMI